jgi:type IX secretion system PorP/SprF family membrane protein
MRKIILTLLILSSLYDLKAQQEAHYTQFMYNNMLINPGFAGARRTPSVLAMYRNQWIGYEGAPTSYQASFDMPIGYTRLGVGGTLARQEEGIEKRNYDVIHTNEATLRFGLNGTVRHYRFGVQDPSIVDDQTDMLLQTQKNNLYKGNIGAGVYFDNKSYYIGVSVPKLIKNSISLDSTQQVVTNSDEFRHLYVQGGAFLRLNQYFHIKPTAILKLTGNTPLSIDASLGIMYDRRFLVGASYRMGNSIYGGSDAFNVLTFYQVTDKLAVGAAYDFTLSEIKRYSQGSLEFLVRYDMSNARTIIKNPRYFF